MRDNRFSNKKGVSVIVSLGIVCMFMLLAASMTPIVISQMKQSASSVSSAQAYYAAESGLQKGLYVLTHAKDIPAEEFASYLQDENLGGSIDLSGCDGQNGSEEPGGGGGVCEEVTADWRIFQSSTTSVSYGGGEFSYPVPGTGTAGTTCDPFNPVVVAEDGLEAECDALEPGDGQQWAKLKCSMVMKGGPGWGSGGKPKADEVEAVLNEYTDPRDLPCNWNKIKYGETVQVPLYGSEGALSFEAFKLRVRTPCKAVCDEGGENCEIPELCSDDVIQGVSEGRYKVEEEPLPVFPLQPPTPDPVKYMEKSKTAIKDTLVLWSVEDGKCSGLYCFLSNMVDIFDNQQNYNKQKASLVTANRINAQQNSSPKYLILSETSTGLKDADKNSFSTILTAVPPILAFLPTSLSDSSYFKLHYAKQGTYAYGVDSKNIPYLEYQLLYNAGGKSLTSSDPLVISEGYAGGFKQTLQARYNPKTGAINYVVQQ